MVLMFEGIREEQNDARNLFKLRMYIRNIRNFGKKTDLIRRNGKRERRKENNRTTFPPLPPEFNVEEC